MKVTIHGTRHLFGENGQIIGSTELTVEGEEVPEEVASGYNLALEKISEGEKDD